MLDKTNCCPEIAEFIGTFSLVFAGCGAIIVDEITDGAVTSLGIALTFGLIVMVVVYAIGHISGAHINPAVTIAFASVGRFPKERIATYITMQILGAITAAFFLLGIFGNVADLGATQPRENDLNQLILLEAILTFFLMFVIISVATDKRTPPEIYGLAIGMTVCLGALFGGPITMASMNPARSIGPALVSGTLSFLWAYIVATIIGAIIAAIAYETIRFGENPMKAYFLESP